MNKQIHILNGDALLEQFLVAIKGNKIVLRECLVEGDISGQTLDEFYQNRAAYLDQAYGNDVDIDYEKEVVLEFKKILAIPRDTDVNLWFEDDLFCQVNLWFALYLLKLNGNDLKTFLVRPGEHTPYGFGYYDPEELMTLLKTREELNEQEKWAKFWPAYQDNALGNLQTIAASLSKAYPFLERAVQAHIDRLPSKNHPGKPKMILTQIMDELDTDDFGEIFQEFNQRAPEYGFGDLQVLLLYNELMAEE